MNAICRSIHHFCFATIVLFALSAGTHAADLQAKTIDGQVIQGEYLGTENNLVRLKTAYGTVLIPSKDIVTLTAVSIIDKPKAAEGAAAPVVVEDAHVEAMLFREPKGVNLASLLAARMPPIPEATKNNRIELFRLVRNFGDSNDSSRQKIIRILSGYGLMAYPYIEGAYTLPDDLDDKVELLQAAAGAHRPFSAGIFSTVHAEVIGEMTRTAQQPPSLPPEVLTQRRSTSTRTQRLRILARNARAIEGYAALSGGPFNTLFLLGIYKERYSQESDALLKDILTDRARLAAIAGDAKNAASGWTLDDRLLLIDMAFPLYFKENEEIKGIGEELLRKLLPEKHPKWDASQADWLEWWGKRRGEMK